MHGTEERVCPYCDGKGYVPVEGNDPRTWVRKDCPLCGGTGRPHSGTDDGTKQQRVKELVAQIEAEQDHDKFTALVQELDSLLDAESVEKPTKPWAPDHALATGNASLADVRKEQSEVPSSLFTSAG